MDIVIAVLSLLVGVFISYYILNKKLLSLSEKIFNLKLHLKKRKNHAEKLEFVDQLKTQVNSDFKTLASDILKMIVIN